MASCGWIFNFLWLLAVRLSTSCVSNVLAAKPQKQDIFASCGGLRVLAAQELLAPLLARALFLGCTVNVFYRPYCNIIIVSLLTTKAVLCSPEMCSFCL